MDARISVIIPTFDRADWLGGAIESVLTQSLRPQEVIVVDDGSQDDTRRVVDGFPDVNYVFRENSGPAAARNHGAALAQGAWLAFLDSDDRWHREKLERQVDFLQRFPEFEVVYTDEIWIRNGRRVNPRHKHAKCGGWIYEACVPLCRISPSSVLLSRSVWDALGGFDPDFPACEDYDLWLRMACRYPIGYLDEKLIDKYGGHKDQLSRQWGLDRYRVIALERMLTQPLSEGWRQATIASLIERCRILEAGFRKRGHSDAADAYAARVRRWENMDVAEPPCTAEVATGTPISGN